MRRILSILFLTMACCLAGVAKDLGADTEVLYRQSHSVIDLNYQDNRQTIDSLAKRMRQMSASDSLFIIKHLKFIGTASPEGSVAYNDFLSQQRAEGLKQYMTRLLPSLSNVDYGYEFTGRNWIGLYELVNKDFNVPARTEVLKYLNNVLDKLFSGQSDDASNLNGLKLIDSGRAYNYMYSELFPQLRTSIVHIDYSFRPYDRLLQPVLPVCTLSTDYVTPGLGLVPVTFQSHNERNFYMALKTNMLYDALALPSVGAEFYLGKNFSIVGNWTYGWWDTNRRHRYWRAYGGDIALRWWFGEKANAKPLTGHHIGVYGGAFTYDFEFGGRGYMGGEPSHSLWDKCLLNGGIEYGYSLPVSRRLNIDFTIGIGYISGQYYEYIPQDGHYVWQSTHNLNWFGPTKAEISLVWLIGHGNYNNKKGGRP